MKRQEQFGNFAKVINPATIEVNGRQERVFCKIEWDGKNLSISGVVGPRRSGNCLGSCGQIDGDFKHRDPSENDARTSSPIAPGDMTFVANWTAEIWLDFLHAWAVYHLNDLTAGCEHQVSAGWDKMPIDPSKPTTAYGKFFLNQKQDSWNLLSWIRPDEHPHGLMAKPCPVCGYKYGTAWKTTPVPVDVLKFLDGLPETVVKPAWI